ncbi:hypothetical protein BC831DRAFT_481514 [Entophlyctis helioformis]|nr:hypothetical protein BC831DRAFT_481514 [Entophlyctis helioformis]
MPPNLTQLMDMEEEEQLQQRHDAQRGVYGLGHGGRGGHAGAGSAHHTPFVGRPSLHNRIAGMAFGRSGGSRPGHSHHGSPGPHGHTQRLNEDDEDAMPNLPQGRLFALFSGMQGSGSRGATLPLNMDILMRAEESRLVAGADEATRAAFAAHVKRPLSTATTQAETDDSSNIKRRVDFTGVAGLDDHVASLKEMVVLPLMYPEICERFDIVPPRGVLFHGPPGTGKTLMARALASSCSGGNGDRPVAFFLRKGADILSKWVGESERQLRVLFEQAKAWQPTVECVCIWAGLAPVRTSKQDQIHASIVSTLLALMDGLDARGQVVVIGATNRLDAIDPALRRPGRFDREFYFGLPQTAARRHIIDLATRAWDPPVKDTLKHTIAELTAGYNGADVKALCTEAALCAVRRRVPHIYSVPYKVDVQAQDIRVEAIDFYRSMKKMVSSTERSGTLHGGPLAPTLALLLKTPFDEIRTLVASMTGILQHARRQMLPASFGFLRAFEPRILVAGLPGMGQGSLGNAAVDLLRTSKVYVQTIDLALILGRLDETPESVLLQTFREVKRHQAAAVYLPAVDRLWESLSENSRRVMLSLLQSGNGNGSGSTGGGVPLVVATSDTPVDHMPDELCSLFSSSLGSHVVHGWKRVVALDTPSDAARRSFFMHLVGDIGQPESAFNDPFELDATASAAVQQNALPARRRLHLDEECRRLVAEYAKHRLADIRKPVDRVQNPFYNPPVPMDLSLMDEKNQGDAYETVEAFLGDVDVIVGNAVTQNDVRNAAQRENVAKAYRLRDAALEHVDLLPQELVQACWYYYVLVRTAGFKRLADGDADAGDRAGTDSNAGNDASKSDQTPVRRGAGRRRTRANPLVVDDDDDDDEMDETGNADAVQGGQGGEGQTRPNGNNSSDMQVDGTDQSAADDNSRHVDVPATDIAAATATEPETAVGDVHATQRLEAGRVAQLVDWLTVSTRALTVTEIEDLGVALATVIVQSASSAGSGGSGDDDVYVDGLVRRLYDVARAIMATAE